MVPIPANGVPGTAVEVDNANTNLFCSGHTFLPDGRLFVAGGHQTEDGDGSRNSNTFEYGPPYSWQPGTQMHLGRWYPTATGLVNGDVLVVGGDVLANGQIVLNLVPEVWNSANGTWTQLSGASLSVPLFSPMHLAPNGTVFMSGSAAQSRFLDTSGTGHWIMGPLRQYTGSRDYGSSVLLEDSRVLVMGGVEPASSHRHLRDHRSQEHLAYLELDDEQHGVRTPANECNPSPRWNRSGNWWHKLFNVQ